MKNAELNAYNIFCEKRIALKLKVIKISKNIQYTVLYLESLNVMHSMYHTIT